MKNKNALIGYSGFVGGNLLNQNNFDYLFNSKNIEKIQNKEFSNVVCAGAPGLKWFANKYPEKDLKSINRLMNNLKKIKTEQFVLISTINVYPKPIDVNEDTPIILEDLQPYGRNRRNLELFLENIFHTTIIRLPGLFGKGLKKNILFDLLNNKHQYLIHQNSFCQFYDLENVWIDIIRALENEISILNCATEPIKVKDIGRKCFNINISSNNTKPTSNFSSEGVLKL